MFLKLAATVNVTVAALVSEFPGLFLARAGWVLMVSWHFI
jgi:hypothetical protein